MNEHLEFSQRLGQIVANVAGECLAGGIPYTPAQLQDCVVSLIQLCEVSGGAEALLVFHALVRESISKAYPWGWIGLELRFELLVRITGSRSKAALNVLKRRDGSDASLDTYNERVSRFAQS